MYTIWWSQVLNYNDDIIFLCYSSSIYSSSHHTNCCLLAWLTNITANFVLLLYIDLFKLECCKFLGNLVVYPLEFKMKIKSSLHTIFLLRTKNAVTFGYSMTGIASEKAINKLATWNNRKLSHKYAIFLHTVITRNLIC